MGFYMLAGQSNYAYGNSAVDQLVELRRALELPGTSVQWGPIADVGFVAEVMQVGPNPNHPPSTPPSLSSLRWSDQLTDCPLACQTSAMPHPSFMGSTLTSTHASLGQGCWAQRHVHAAVGS